jgi:hypothetical protein
MSNRLTRSAASAPAVSGFVTLGPIWYNGCKKQRRNCFRLVESGALIPLRGVIKVEENDRQISLEVLLKKFVNTCDDCEGRSLLEEIVETLSPIIVRYVGQKMGVHIEYNLKDSPTHSDLNASKCPLCDTKWNEGYQHCLRCGARRPADRSFQQTPRPMKVEDAEDIVGNTIAALIQRLQSVREGSVRIEGSLRGYALGIADNILHLYWRSNAPQRYRLRNRILYLLQHGHRYGFAMWESDTCEERLCGLIHWRGGQWRPTDRYLEWCSNPLVIRTLFAQNEEPTQVSLPKLMQQFFQWISSPVKLNDLINGMAEVLGVVDATYTLDNEHDNKSAVFDDHYTQHDVFTNLERSFTYQEIWSEIGLLPVQQRRALLLSLEQDELMVFVEYGITTLESVAKLLGMPWEQFWELYRQLPLKDNQIAAYIGLPQTAQQKVINLRKSARERIVRRLRPYSD